MVARAGIEPPTPAFSGLLTDTAKWFRIKRRLLLEKELWKSSSRTAWDDFGCLRLPDVPVLFPPSSARICTGTTPATGLIQHEKSFPGQERLLAQSSLLGSSGPCDLPRRGRP